MKNKKIQKYQTIQKIKRKEQYMEINCKIKLNFYVDVMHYGGGVVSLYSDDYQSTERYHKVLAEIKENNPKLKVTTMSFINEHPQIKGCFKEVSVNFEEKQA